MKKQVFILEISDTRNQSWQGQIEWVQGRRKKSFRSVLELLNLLDSVVKNENRPEFSGVDGCLPTHKKGEAEALEEL